MEDEMKREQSQFRDILQDQLRRVGDIDNSRIRDLLGARNRYSELDAEVWEAQENPIVSEEDAARMWEEGEWDDFYVPMQEQYRKNKAEKDRLESLIKLTHTTNPAAWKHYVDVGTFVGLVKRNDPAWHKQNGGHARFI